MNWRRSLISFSTKKGHQQFIDQSKNPQQAQKMLWQDEILPLLKQSEFWKSRLQDDLAKYPITEYDDYKAAIEQAKQHLINPLNGEAIRFWSESSGTSGSRKYFPISASFQTQFQRTIAPFLQDLSCRFPLFFSHPMLYLTEVDPFNTMPSGVSSGWISNFNYRNMSPIIRRFYALPDLLMKDRATFKAWAPLYALATDLSAILAVTPMVINDFYGLCQTNFAHWYEYLSGEKALPAGLPALKISRKRKRYLKTLDPHGHHAFKTLWPGLQFCCCWTAGLCAAPAQQLQQRMGQEIPLIDGTYSATEGWMSVPLSSDKVGGVVHPGAHVMEFIEEGKALEPDNLIPCWALEPGKQYEIFLTTAMGFVRYRLKDIVKCSGFYHQSPWIEFCYKAQLLKLAGCSLSAQELQSMIDQSGLNMQPHWYFARNAEGTRVILVTDQEATISNSELEKMHQALKDISQTYAYCCGTNEVLCPQTVTLALETLQQNRHAQTKPKLIDPQEVW